MQGTEFWAEYWKSENTPWDMGGPHPSLEALWKMAEPWLKPEGRLYIPACGRAHEAAWFAARGYRVVAEDIVPEAIEEACRLYGKIPGLTLRVGDLFNVSAEDAGSFDAVYDRAACCAFSPERWPAYLAASAQRLKAGGLLLSLPFTESQLPAPKGPPFFTTKAEWEKLVAADFEVKALNEQLVQRQTVNLRKELLAVAQKK